MRLPEATGPLPSVKKHTGESRASARTLISGRFISYISRSLPEQISAAVKNASCPPALSPTSETLPGAPEKLPAFSFVFFKEGKRSRYIAKLVTEGGFRRKGVVHVEHREAALRKADAEISVVFLYSGHPSAAVDREHDRASGVLTAAKIYVKHVLTFPVAEVINVLYFFDTVRKGKRHRSEAILMPHGEPKHFEKRIINIHGKTSKKLRHDPVTVELASEDRADPDGYKLTADEHHITVYPFKRHS